MINKKKNEKKSIIIEFINQYKKKQILVTKLTV